MSIALSAAVPVRQDGKGGVTAKFTLEEGKSQVFILREDSATETVPAPPTDRQVEELFEKNGEILAALCLQQVYRSALALKLLTFELTGAIIAAPTNSLPK